MDEIKDILKTVIIIEVVNDILIQNDPQYQMLNLMRGLGGIMATSMIANAFANQMIVFQVNRIYEKAKRCEELANELYQYVTG